MHTIDLPDALYPFNSTLAWPFTVAMSLQTLYILSECNLSLSVWQHLENVRSGTECSVQPAQFKKNITSPASWLPRTLVIGWPQGGLSFSLPASCVCVLNWATMAGKVDASCQTTMPRHCVDLGWIPVHWVSDPSTRLDLLINVLIAYSNLLFRLTVDTANLHMIKC